MRNFYKFTYLILFSICAKAQVPTATIVSTANLLCTGQTVTLTAAGTTTDVSFKWTITPAKTITITPSGSDSIITFFTASAGTYTASLLLTRGTATAQVNRTFNILRSAKASFNASLSGQGFPSQLSLTNYSSNSLKHYWIFDGNTAQLDSSAVLVKNYTASGNHSVTLVALGLGGCNDASTYEFRLADSSGITLPNVFSPNNDGVNDVYRPIAKGLVSINAWVYNRHGVIIASWDKINGFWDGYTTSGEPCDMGSYFVIVEATGFDGAKYKLKGNITLLR